MKNQLDWRKLGAMLLCLIMALTMLLTACKPQTPPTPGPDGPGTDDPGTDGPGDNLTPPVDDKYVELSALGNKLYDATYQTMLDRLMPNGYASTSLAGGAYGGMFVRDSSIQVMQHIAEGDMEAAKRILQYMAAVHKALNRDYALHILNPLMDDERYDYMTGHIQPPTNNKPSKSMVAQTGTSAGLYLINLPDHQVAQKVKIPFDTIKEVKIYLQVGSSSGTLELSIGKEAGDDSIASAYLDIEKVGKGNQWYTFEFDQALSVEPGAYYVFTIGAADTNGSVVAPGEYSCGAGAYNYDKPNYGGWLPEAHSIAYEIRSDLSIVGEENAITQYFTTQGDRIETITVSVNAKKETTLHAVLLDESGAAIKTLSVPAKTGEVVLNFDGMTVQEGKKYGLKLWAEGESLTWNLGITQGDAFQGDSKEPMGDTFELNIAPEYSGTRLGAFVTVGGQVVAIQQLPVALNAQHVTSAALYLSSVGTAGKDDTFTVSLYKGNVLVDEQTVPLSTLTDKAASYYFQFCLPIKDVVASAEYSIRVSASREGSVKWYGYGEKDAARPATLDGTAQNMVLSYRVGCSTVTPRSDKNQVDGHYMWVNAFAMFVLEAEKSYDGVYDDFIETIYPFMAEYAEYYFVNETDISEDKYAGLYYINEETGLLYNPSYEHSRNGRYWRAYDLITNVFASEAMHKMSEVAKLYGTDTDSGKYQMYADDLAEAIHESLTCQFEDKTIYAEMINTEHVNAQHPTGKITPGMIRGFSFVTLAPMAAEWYAMDKEIMQNTYEAYLKVGTEKYNGVDMLAVVVDITDADKATYWGNHVIGKGFAWELHYCWLNEDTERVEELLTFMERSSKNLTYLPETWHKDGGTSDSANQEHANWILYTLARISGRTQK